jgi:hypothetical protein
MLQYCHALSVPSFQSPKKEEIAIVLKLEFVQEEAKSLPPAVTLCVARGFTDCMIDLNPYPKRIQ